MNPFAYAWGEILPGTWYLTARIDQTIRGTPLDLSWKPVLVLAIFVIALVSLTVLRLWIIRERAAAEAGSASAVREAIA
jgi:ABC-2 type transport system permease protein